MQNSLTYPIDIDIGDDGVTATFPDLPYGIVSGENIEELYCNAPDVLEEVLAGLVNEKKDVPAPSDLNGRASTCPSARFAAKILLYKTLREQGMTKAELARRLNWGYQQVDRLFDFKHASHFSQLDSAFAVLGRRLTCGMEEIHIFNAA